MANMQLSDFERYPDDEEKDETDVNLRCYFTRMDDAKLDTYDPEMTDEELLEWDENFKDDGTLMLTCSEREVDAHEYRRVMNLYLEFRKKLEKAGAR